MKNSTFKRFLSLVMALTMVVSYAALPVSATQESSEPTACSYGEYTVVNEATCGAAGKKTAVCSFCEDVKEEAIPATGEHTYGEYTVVTEATCGAAGKKTAVCSVCEDVKEEAIPATGEHNYENGVCSVCSQNKPCSLAEGCDAPVHVEDCLSQCNGTVTCGNKVHKENCLSQMDCTCVRLCADTKGCPVCEGNGTCLGDKAAERIAAVQALINALPTNYNFSESAAVKVQYDACTEAIAELTELERAELDLTNYAAAAQPTVIDDSAASIGETKYVTLKEAFENADGKTIVVNRDIELTEGITVPAGKTITLNLNGKTVSQTKACTASYEMINNKGTLTITGNGKLSFKDTGAGDPKFGWGSYTIRNEGTLVVENGTIEHLGEHTPGTHCIQAIFQYSGSTTINGGTIRTPKYRSLRLWHGSMTINGGTMEGQVWVQTQKGAESTLTINGGTFAPAGNDGSSVFVTNDNNTVTLNITGGTFTTKVGATSFETLKGKIIGGKFANTVNIGTMIPLGYVLEEDGSVVPGSIKKSEESTTEVSNPNNITEVTANSAVTGEDSTNASTIITSEEVANAIKDLDTTGAASVEISMKVEIQDYKETSASTSVITFEVAPYIQPVDDKGNHLGTGTTITEVKNNVTFRLPMPDGTKGKIAKVMHEHEEGNSTFFGAYEILGDNEGKNCYIELASKQFSEWEVEIQKSTEANVDGVPYVSLKEALAQVEDGDTVKLLKDIEITEQLVIDNKKTFTLDGNNKTITAENFSSGEYNNFMVDVRFTDVTIQNLTVNANGLVRGIQFYQCDGTLNNVTIQNVKVWCAVHVNTAEVAITGNLTVTDAEGYGSLIALSYGENIESNLPVSLNVASSAKVTGVTGVYADTTTTNDSSVFSMTVPASSGIPAPSYSVAKIGNTYYASLDGALAVGGNVEVLADIALSNTLTVAKEVVLNMGTHKISIAEDAEITDLLNVTTNGKLTISNGTFDGGLKTSGGQLIISGGTINGAVSGTSTVTINGGNLKNTVTITGNISNGVFKKAVTITGNITGGTFEEEVTITGNISNGTFAKNVTVTGNITGGTFKTDISNYLSALYQQNATTGKVTAATPEAVAPTVTTGTGVDTNKDEVKNAAANTTVNNANATVSSTLSSKIYSDDMDDIMDKLQSNEAVANNPGADLQITLKLEISKAPVENNKVTSITYDVSPVVQVVTTGAGGVKTVVVEEPINELKNEITITLPVPFNVKYVNLKHSHGEGSNPVITDKGDIPVQGTYPNGYITYTTKQFSELTITPKSGTAYVAKVDTTSYTDIADAVAQMLATGKTMELLTNVTTANSITIPSGKTATINLGGKTLTYTGTGSAIINNGTLTLRNGTITANAGVKALTSNGTATISSGTYNGIVSGTVTITGGTFNAAVGGTMTITGGTFNSPVEGDVTIKGGTFEAAVSTNVAIPGTIPGATAGTTAANPARFKVAPAASSIQTNYIAVKDATNYYTIQEKPHIIVDGVNNYSSLEAYLATNPSNKTIKLTQNETVNGTYTLSGVTIDLNGFNILSTTTSAGCIKAASNGIVTIKNIGKKVQVDLVAGDLVSFTSTGLINVNPVVDNVFYGSVLVTFTSTSTSGTPVSTSTWYYVGISTETQLSINTNGNIFHGTDKADVVPTSASNTKFPYSITVNEETHTGNTFIIGSSKNMVVASNGFHYGLSSVVVTGEGYLKVLDANHHSVTRGSTIVTLKNAYLKTLSKGKYTITLNYQDGLSVATNFYVSNAAKPACNPQTGDMILTSVVLMAAAAAGLGVMMYIGKKKKK